MRNMFAAILALAIGFATAAAAESIEARVLRELQSQGFHDITGRRTLLGRIRITAEGPGVLREIVVNPRTGEILRDYVRPSEDGDRADDDGDRRGAPGGRGSGASGDDRAEDERSGQAEDGHDADRTDQGSGDDDGNGTADAGHGGDDGANDDGGDHEDEGNEDDDNDEADD